jgi:hypothetical protein
MGLRIGVAIIALFGFLGNAALASSCTAHNDNGGTCSVDCDAGKSAECSNASGSSAPTCECSG